ncbi:MAG: hypothetical protein KDD25_10215 [Bdellovibrionales bacterium]|nr:hypothetical protein [Bdellovibrionales bacterium]
MKIAVALVLLLSSTPLFAHLEPGVYQGTNQNGTVCSLEVVRTYFKDHVHHPLNERVEVKLMGTTLDIQHPAIVDLPGKMNPGRVSFNHDLFQGVSATTNGGEAVTLEFDHDKKVPTAFFHTVSDWTNKTDLTSYCVLN